MLDTLLHQRTDAHRDRRTNTEMAVESNYLQLVGTFWEWIKQDISTWARALGNLKVVISEYDIESDDTLKFVLRFAAFSIVIAILVDYPAFIVFHEHTMSISFVIVEFILYYIFIFLSAISARIMAFITFSSTSIRRCSILALFASVYLPIQNLLDYIIFSNKKLIAVYSGDIGNILELSREIPLDIVMLGIGSVAISVFVAIRLISATRYVFHVGTVRALVIVAGTAIIQTVFQVLPMRPFMEAFFKD
jgi:hypothetical protein